MTKKERVMALAGVKEALEGRKNSQRSSQSDGPRRLWLRLKDGESATFRALEEGEEFVTAWTHTYERRGTRQDGSTYTYYEEVLADGKYDYDEQGNAPRFKFWLNVIWRDGPVFATDAEGKIIREGKEAKVERNEDVVAVLSGGITLAETLDGLESQYKGLTSRDFVISRKGSTKDDTKYTIKPVGEEDEDGNLISKKTPLSDNDKKLAQGKNDLQELKEGLVASSPSPQETRQERSEDNPFKRRK